MKEANWQELAKGPELIGAAAAEKRPLAVGK